MAFSDYGYPDVIAAFGLTFANDDDLFARVPPLELTAPLREMLPAMTRLAAAVSTEKARSEWMIAPLLAELWARHHGRIGVYSGVDFPADPDAGLTGFCDFLVSRSPQQMSVTAPVLLVFEAKKENIAGGLGQCVAGMVGAQRFNRRANQPSECIFGCVTTGTAWRFLSLRETTLTLDLTEYSVTQADKLLGILTHIVDV